jgi:hypothetical protein
MGGDSDFLEKLNCSVAIDLVIQNPAVPDLTNQTATRPVHLWAEARQVTTS